MNQEKTSFFDHRENIKKVLHVLYGICAVLLVADVFIHRHVIHDWESVTGFYAFFGFIACVTLVLLAKELRKLVMRGEDYYEKGIPGENTDGG